jgi:predicted ribosomally synthesized peptide with nif11-like leader
MSIQALTDFGKKCTMDEKAREGLRKVSLVDLDAVIKYAAGLGFMVTKEDFMTLAQKPQTSQELSEEQLDKISGGFWGGPPPDLSAMIEKLLASGALKNL